MKEKPFSIQPHISTTHRQYGPLNTAGNYHWLHKLLCELCEEYTYRYGKVHKCQNWFGRCITVVPIQNQVAPLFTQPTPAMPDACKVTGDSLKSYRNYYIMEKQRMWSWKGKINSRTPPPWFKEWTQNVLQSLSYGYS
jgi:hypothetical protein